MQCFREKVKKFNFKKKYEIEHKIQLKLKLNDSYDVYHF